MAKRKQLSRKNSQDRKTLVQLSCYCTAVLSAQSVPGFSGCIFNNCTFQFASLPAVSQVTDATVHYHDDLTGIDLAELFYFQLTLLLFVLYAALLYSLLAIYIYIYGRWHGKIGCIPTLKPYMQVLGALRWLLPCGNFVTSCTTSFDV